MGPNHGDAITLAGARHDTLSKFILGAGIWQEGVEPVNAPLEATVEWEQSPVSSWPSRGG
jgi:hypothetical protein